MSTNTFTVMGNLVDVWKKSIYAAEITVTNRKIESIKNLHKEIIQPLPYILPGFIDSHVHVESSMLIPSEFARLAVVHGTVGTISDPHEIANVCGMKGVEFMIDNGKKVPFKFHFGAPSCVPATTFETAGATLNADDVEKLLKRDDVKYLSEMMNFPGVLHKNAEVMKKIAAAKKLGKPVDGHAPGLKGEQAKQYIQASLNPSEGGTLDPETQRTLTKSSGVATSPPLEGLGEASYEYQTADKALYGLLKDFVKEHRSNPTNAEITLWELLKGKKLEGYKFRRQHIIGSFIADFVSLPSRLIIEVDGLIHQLPENKFNDKERTKELNRLGFDVIRFTNDEVLYKTDNVLEEILQHLRQASLNPSEGGTLEPETQRTLTKSSGLSTSPPLEGLGEASYEYQTADKALYGLLKDFVKEHRSNPTNAEITLWELLRGKKLEGYKFRRQHIIGSFIADFVSLPSRLIIEVDGLIHQLPENKFNDKERTKELNRLGFDVIRFTNDEVLYKTDNVLEEILQHLRQASLNPSEGGTLEPETQRTLTKSSGLSTSPPLEGLGEAVVISTDHECFTEEEAADKLSYGMKILIREGSAAKNFEALIPLMNEHYEMMMFCSDDKHPDSLVEGHINQLCARAVAKGIDVFKVLQAACVNPVLHYKMDVGLLREGDDADFVLVNDLKDFHIHQTYINGELVAEHGRTFIKSIEEKAINQFNCTEITADALKLKVGEYPNENGNIPVIEALDGQLITNKLMLPAKEDNGELESDLANDVLKMVVVNRYKNAPVAKCFIKNFGLKKGALASSVAHDSHNIVAVGVDDESLARAINLVIKEQGGVSAVASPQPLSKEEGQENLTLNPSSKERDFKTEMVLGLPVAGLMSADDGYKVAEAYTNIDKMTKDELGSTLMSPFMTLSFMALLVIPHLKLSDLGLFDGGKFEFVK